MRIVRPLVTLAVGTAAALTFAGPVFAGGHDITPGGKCSHVGQTGHHGQETYRCTQKPGDDCPRWHWSYRSGTPKSGRTSWPTGPRNCSPSPSHSASPSPSGSPSGSPSATPSDTPTPSDSPSATGTPAGGGPAQLPVTGPGLRDLYLALFGAASIWVGRKLYRYGRQSNPTTPAH